MRVSGQVVRGVVPTSRLAGARDSVAQFMEGLPERLTRCAPGSTPKYALGLKLTDADFDHTVLSEFRFWMVRGRVELLLRDALLE